MSEDPVKRPEAESSGIPAPHRGEFLGRILFLVAGGVLLAAMVSCACGPVR